MARVHRVTAVARKVKELSAAISLSDEHMHVQASGAGAAAGAMSATRHDEGDAFGATVGVGFEEQLEMAKTMSLMQ